MILTAEMGRSGRAWKFVAEFGESAYYRPPVARTVGKWNATPHCTFNRVLDTMRELAAFRS